MTIDPELPIFRIHVRRSQLAIGRTYHPVIGRTETADLFVSGECDEAMRSITIMLDPASLRAVAAYCNGLAADIERDTREPTP